MSTFSFSDRFRPILNSCLPCFTSDSSNQTHASSAYFPDSDHQPLLNEEHQSDLISLHSNLNLHQFDQEFDELFNPSSNTSSTLKSISSWIASHLWFQNQIHSNSNSYQSSSHHRRPSESDARVLQSDFSFLVSPQNRKSSQHPLNQLQPVYPQTTMITATPTDDQLRQEEETLAAIEEEEYRLARKRAKKKAKALGLLHPPNSSKASSSQSLSQPSNDHKPKTQSRLRPHSPHNRSSRSSKSSDISDCDLFSNPTINSTNTDASVPHTLTPEIIQSIRNTFGADAEELYGEELTLVQIEQIYHHLESKRQLDVFQSDSPHPDKTHRSKSHRDRPTSSSNEDYKVIGSEAK
ncbi:hypothetical protein DFH28DRAFT_309605 [Melampsora americana]|nr:hypothetical protein DFH28DRAFT_309605 [Melampsora americana]